MRKFVALMLLSVLSWMPHSSQAAVWELVYPQFNDSQNPNEHYPLELLQLALDETGVKYRLIPSANRYEQGQALKNLAASREIQVLWSMTDANRENQLLPIRVPIYKGLIGLRLFFAHDDAIDGLGKVNDLAGLRSYKVAQGKDWPDTKILQFNGFEVVNSAMYDKLFDVVGSKQAQLFPRSVVEIWHEQDRWQSRYPIQIEQKLGLYYPTAVYFFVNRKNKVLANLIETGLEKAIESGRYDALFERTFEPMLEKARLSERTIYQLENPVLPPNTPLARKALWYKVPTITTSSPEQP